MHGHGLIAARIKNRIFGVGIEGAEGFLDPNGIVLGDHGDRIPRFEGEPRSLDIEDNMIGLFCRSRFVQKGALFNFCRKRI